MSNRRNDIGFGFTFFGMLGAVMGALKLKQHWDAYREVSTEEEGRVALASPSHYRDEEDIGLLHPDEGAVERPKRRRSNCCVCCGMNCGLFWKAFGIVLGGFILWNAFKLVRWAMTPAPTGLESMPAYSTSLGCISAPYLYNSSKVTLNIPAGTSRSDHSVDIHGGAVGTFIIAQGSAESTEVQYEMTIRSDDQSLLENISLRYPAVEPGTPVADSRFLISTPFPELNSLSCIRYDITMYVPPALKKLHVSTHTLAHVQFDPRANLNLDDFSITLFASNENNMILPHANIFADHMKLEIFRGWIVGDVSIVNSTTITTQRGDGISNVRVHPAAPVDPTSPDPAYLQTTTGAGRTDIFYVNDKALPHRPINSVHRSSRNADVYLTYRDAEFNGLVELNSRSFTGSGLRAIMTPKPAGEDEENDDKEKWTHSVGDKNGKDELFVKSGGWTGIYF